MILRRLKEKGAITILVALGISAFLGMLALTVDLGWLYYNKSILDGATEAAALSAGYTLGKNTRNKEIRSEVLKILSKNGINEADADVNVFVQNDKERVFVDVKREVKFFIAPIFGYDKTELNCNKRVQLSYSSTGEPEPKLLPPLDEKTSHNYDIVPWGMPLAKWDFNEEEGFYKYFAEGIEQFTEGEEYVLKLGTEYIDLSSDLELDYIDIPELERIEKKLGESGEETDNVVSEYEDSEDALGDIVPWGLVAPDPELPSLGLIAGQTYILKISAVKANAGKPAEPELPGNQSRYHGNFGALSLGGNGGNVYRNNIKYGYQGVIYAGMKVNTEPGNMVGPTSQGIEYRINNNKLAIRVPIVNTLDLNGRKLTTILGVKRFMLESQDSTKGWVYGTFTDDSDDESAKAIYHIVNNDSEDGEQSFSEENPVSGITFEKSAGSFLTIFPKNAKTTKTTGIYTINYLSLSEFELIPEEILEAAQQNEIVQGFEVDGNQVTTKSKCDITIRVLGTQLGNSSGQLVPIGATAKIGANEYIFNKGKQVNPNDIYVKKNVPAGTNLYISGKMLPDSKLGKSAIDTWKKNNWPIEYSTEVSTEQIYVLKNGDTPREVAPGFPVQTSLNDIISPYIDENGKIKIGDNEAIYLFDFNYVPKGYGIDYQDLIVLATAVAVPETVVEANIPENSSDSDESSQESSSSSVFNLPVISDEDTELTGINVSINPVDGNDFVLDVIYNQTIDNITKNSGSVLENFEVMASPKWHTAPAGSEIKLEISATMNYNYYKPIVTIEEEETIVENVQELGFEKEQNEIVAKTKCDVQVKVLGSQFGTSNGYILETAAEVKIGSELIKFNNGNRVNPTGGEVITINDVEPGTRLNLIAKVIDSAYLPTLKKNPSKYVTEVKTEDNSTQVYVLKNGDVPKHFQPGFPNQASAGLLIKDYINADGKVTIKDNEVLYLVDFNKVSAGYGLDFQDMIFLATAVAVEETVQEPVQEDYDSSVLAGDNKKKLRGYDVEFISNEYNPSTDKTSFTYKVKGSGAKYALSHFTVGVPSELMNKIDVCLPNKDIEKGKDPTTGVSGVKWDFGIGKTATQAYTIVFNGRIKNGAVDVAVKGGPGYNKGELNGPGEIMESAVPVVVEEPEEVEEETTVISSTKYNVSWEKSSKSITVKGYYTIVKLRSNYGVLDLNNKIEDEDDEQYLRELKFGHKHIYNLNSLVDTLPSIFINNSYLGTLFNYEQDKNTEFDALSEFSTSQRLVIVPFVSPTRYGDYIGEEVKNSMGKPSAIYNYYERDKVNIIGYGLFYLSKPEEPVKIGNSIQEFSVSSNPKFSRNGEIKGKFVKWHVKPFVEGGI